VDPIDQALATVDREWRSYGLNERDRTTLAADLRLDLQAAGDDGATPSELIGPDVRGFARRLADEAGITPIPAAYSRVVGTGLVGAVLGLAVGYLVVNGVFALCVAFFDLGFRPPLLLSASVFYVSAASFMVAGAVTTVRIHLRELPRSRATAAAMAVILPIGGALATALTMGFAALTNYSLDPVVVCTELALVVGTVVATLLLARRWSLRARNEQNRKPAAVPA
jgi:hypothetical protein